MHDMTTEKKRGDALTCEAPSSNRLINDFPSAENTPKATPRKHKSSDERGAPVPGPALCPRVPAARTAAPSTLHRLEEVRRAGKGVDPYQLWPTLRRLIVHVRHPHTGEMAVGDMTLEDCLAMSWAGEA
jgi:hypothetical protein